MSIQTPRVSIGLPVYNGERFAGEAIESILGQTFGDFELIISDNASTDNTEAICRAYAVKDKRVRYYRNDENLGSARNYTRVFKLASGEFFKWAAHDDVCLPEFLSRCVEILDQDPSVVLCYTRTMTIDAQGQIIKKWKTTRDFGSTKAPRRFRETLASLETFPVWGVIRANVLRGTRLLGNYPEHDRPLLTGLSLYGSFYEVPEFLFLDREHKDRSIRRYDFRKPHETIAWYDPKRADKVIFPAWRLFGEHTLGISRAPLSIGERMACYLEMCRWLRCHRQQLVRDLVVAGNKVPGVGGILARSYQRHLESRWLRKTKRSVKDLESIVPGGGILILADDANLDVKAFGSWRTIPFPEQGGKYWGPPPDDSTAIHELERLRQSGAKFIVFAWPTFWWFAYYSEFYEYLKSQFSCVLQNDRLVVFDLRG